MTDTNTKPLVFNGSTEQARIDRLLKELSADELYRLVAKRVSILHEKLKSEDS